MCIRICIFNLKKKQQQQQQQQQQKHTEQTYVENLTGYDDSVCEFALCTFDLLDHVVSFSCLFV